MNAPSLLHIANLSVEVAEPKPGGKERILEIAV